MIKLEKLVFNSFHVNTYILFDETNECIIIDPACYSEEEKKALEKFILHYQLTPKIHINTHCHIDHILGMHFVREKYKIESWAHKGELYTLKNGPIMGDVFGFVTEPFPMPEKLIEDGETIKFGNSELKALHVPGHSEGSLAFYSEEGKFVITGDALFAGSIGRTDLPGGNYDTLIESIQNKLFSLPTGTSVWPGHGDSSTIENELNSNPFFNT